MRLPGFLGPTNVLASLNCDPEETINLIIEAVDVGTPKVPRPSYRRPGIDPFLELRTSPVRALFGMDGRAFTVAGNRFYEFTQAQTADSKGIVAVDQNPATMFSNGQEDGHQLFIVSGGRGYIFDLLSDAFTEIADVDFLLPVLMGSYINNKFLGLKTLSNQFYWSALNDGLLWNGLDTARVSQTSDQVRCLIASHHTLWVFGSQNCAVWLDVALGNTIFQPIQSANMNMGTAASFSPTLVDNSVYWIGENQDGSRMVFKADGYTPSRISTHAVETYLDALPDVSGAIGWTYQERGHTFYVLYLPTAHHSLVYDVSSKTWIKYAVWDDVLCQWFPYLGRCHTYAFGWHLVGDRQSGCIYKQHLPYVDPVSRVLLFADDNMIVQAGL